MFPSQCDFNNMLVCLRLLSKIPCAAGRMVSACANSINTLDAPPPHDTLTESYTQQRPALLCDRYFEFEAKVN